MTKTYDAVVIGAGAIGSAVAYFLTSKGLSVALLDRGDVAGGSSSHCDAVALISDKQPGIDTQMGAASVELYVELAKHFSYDFEFDRKGSLYVCETEEELEAAERYCRQQAADGYDIQTIDNATLCEMEPYLARDMVGGLWTPGDAAMSPYKVCFAFTEEGKKLGLDVFTYVRVDAVNAGKTGIESVETDIGTFKTKRVINCGGVWAPEIGKLSGLEIPVFPRKGMNLVSERTKKICFHKILEYGYMMSKFDDINFTRKVSPLVEEYNVAFNIEYTKADNILLGGYRGFRGFDIRAEAEAMKAIAERGLRFFPCLEEVNCIRAYAGVRPFVPDHLPIMSAVDSIPGYYIAAGHEGDGICLSPISGKLMSQIICHEPTEFDISKLSFSRFAK